ILIPIFGISGAAWAFFMAYIVHSFLLLAWNVAQGQRYFAIPYEWKTGAIFLSYYLASCLMLSLVAELEAAVRTALYVLHLLLSLRLFYVMLSAEERSSVKHLIRGFSWTHIRSRP
ncbi:MAG: hypothetical protein J5J00_05360, partial [Deltaproteobacteria bacterium]|nr:hypothetical protein [Deltaproteobacteria bacterium]